MIPNEEWRAIPGFDGMYEINRQGCIRSWRWRRDRKASAPREMKPYQHQHHPGKLFIKLTDREGRVHEHAVLTLVVNTWFGGKPKGLVAYHKNGDLTDHCLNNIGFISRHQLGKMTGAKSRRKPVAKISLAGEIVEVYSSARVAARANHMSYQTVLDRCHNKVKRPYALDGYTYKFDD